jgi:hypothetical protein
VFPLVVDVQEVTQLGDLFIGQTIAQEAREVKLIRAVTTFGFWSTGRVGIRKLTREVEN